MSFHIPTTRSALTLRRHIVDVVAAKTVVMIVFIILLKEKKLSNRIIEVQNKDHG